MQTVKTLKKSKHYSATPATVFERLDDLGVTGMHMTKSSLMMMGSKLNLQYLSPGKKGPGTKYRWTGRMIGMMLDFTVQVTEWIAGKEKTWETVGPAKLIIYSWYRMHFDITQAGNKSLVELSISYEKPAGLFSMLLYFIFADWYGRWCLKQMLNDAERSLRQSAVKK